MGRPRKYPPELLERGSRAVIESGRPIAQVARDLGVPPETLRRHVRQWEAEKGLRPDLPTAAEREEIKQLRKENYELRRANEILKAASVFFRDRARRRPAEVSAFIDAHRDRFGVEPICRILGVSESAYYQRRSGARSRRSVEDEQLLGAIQLLQSAQLVRVRGAADVAGAAPRGAPCWS